MNKRDNISFFLDHYDDCRRAFLSLVETATMVIARVDHTEIPVRKTDEVVDAVMIRCQKKRSKKLILISSGIHGAEGFVGSAVQAKLLWEMVGGDLKLESDILFLHGINPDGFRHHRRVNERNVDLNRNFFFKRERLPRKEKNKAYRIFKSFFAPALQFSLYVPEFIFFTLRFFGILLRHGPRKFTDAAVNGQFEFKKGIYYGGKKPQPIVKQLRDFFRKEISTYKEILLLDLHTGYGEKNGVILIQNAPIGSAEDENIKRITSDLPLLKPDSGQTFYHTAGDFTDFLGRVFPNKKGLIPLTLEIGTTGNMDLWGALTSSFIVVAENRIHHHGSWFLSTEKKIRSKFLRLFYPTSSRWRENALRTSTDLCKTMFQRFEKK